MAFGQNTLGQNGTWSKWHFVEMALGQNDTWSEWPLVKITLGQEKIVFYCHLVKTLYKQWEFQSKWHVFIAQQMIIFCHFLTLNYTGYRMTVNLLKFYFKVLFYFYFPDWVGTRDLVVFYRYSWGFRWNVVRNESQGASAIYPIIIRLTRESLLKEKDCTDDLLVLTSSDQVLFYWNDIFLFLQNKLS